MEDPAISRYHGDFLPSHAVPIDNCVGQTRSASGETSSPEGRNRGETGKSGSKGKPRSFRKHPLLVSDSPRASWKPLCVPNAPRALPAHTALLALGAASAAASSEPCSLRCPRRIGSTNGLVPAATFAENPDHSSRQNHH